MKKDVVNKFKELSENWLKIEIFQENKQIYYNPELNLISLCPAVPLDKLDCFINTFFPQINPKDFYNFLKEEKIKRLKNPKKDLIPKKLDNFFQNESKDEFDELTKNEKNGMKNILKKHNQLSNYQEQNSKDKTQSDFYDYYSEIKHSDLNYSQTKEEIKDKEICPIEIKEDIYEEELNYQENKAEEDYQIIKTQPQNMNPIFNSEIKEEQKENRNDYIT